MEKKSSFVIVDLVGGLGNQLFGLAFGSALSDKLESNLRLDKSLIHFGSNHERILEIQNFEFNLPEYRITQSFLVKTLAITKNKLLKKISGKMIMMKRKSVKEANIKSERDKSNKRYAGYFQDWMYSDYLLRNNYNFFPTLKNKKFNQRQLFHDFNNLNPILVHVRLGDYLNFSNIYEILPEQYFLSAVERLINSNKSRPVWLIIEELEQVKHFYPNLVKLSTKFIDKSQNFQDHESFYLMSKSNDLVASNSTFSLWASWFVLNNGGNVIVPSDFNVSGVPSKLIDGRFDSINILDFTFIPKGNLEAIRATNLIRFNELFL
jgi:hypothetical protein